MKIFIMILMNVEDINDTLNEYFIKDIKEF